jgi:rubrerythrin
MDSQKYLVIITLIDGQNFTVPSGDRIEASIFAEARFGNESVLRSDPIKLTNSNPEFLTELVWQLDKKSLHRLRVERKAIKLQVFMRTKECKKAMRSSYTGSKGAKDDNISDETQKVELIGYTILDLRSAPQIEQPNQFRWCPLLNPKFRRSSYNRPEIQLAVTLNRIEEEENRDDSNHFSSICSLADGEQANESLESINNQADACEPQKGLESWMEDSFNKLAEEFRRREAERFVRLSARIEAKEAKRDLEFKKKLDDLNKLEKKFLHSLANIDCLEKMLKESIEHLKTKYAILDDRLNMI